MAEGRSATHGHSIRRHPHGWGALWTGTDMASDWTIVRETSPVADADLPAIFGGAAPRMLAVHARHASESGTRGIPFTHPICAHGRAIMHNGYAPNIAALLGMPRSAFDTAELLQYLFSDPGRDPSCAQIAASLRAIGPGMSAANFFVVTPGSVYVVNWFDESLGLADYYTMWAYTAPRLRIFSSERLPELGPAAAWQTLGHGTVLRLSHATEANG